MITLTPNNQKNNKQLNRLAEQVFYKSIELLGGLNYLAEYRTLTWLPSLARACFVVVLKREYLKTDNEIAEYLGITVNTVRNILTADPEKALYKVEHMEELSEDEKKQFNVHVAGGIAKLAFEKIKHGEQAQTMVEYGHSMAEEAMSYCDAPWAYLVLKHTRGIDYPVTSPDILINKLSKAQIKDFNVDTVVKSLEYPITSPADLLKKIKQKI